MAVCFDFCSTNVPQWESTQDKVTPRDQGLQKWTGGTWNIIKLIGINFRFALIDKKAQEQF